MTKKPTLLFITADDVRNFRKQAGLNQRDFWARIDVTQSGGSRYESGRVMPKQVSHLLQLVYGTHKQAEAYLAWLRKDLTQL